MKVRFLALPLAMLLATSGCMSLWQQRTHQAVAWEDGDPARIEVWLRQGTTWLGQPLFFLLDTLATPVLWIGESAIAIAAWDDPDAAIAGGPFGYLVSLLPGFTCVPIDSHPSSFLRLGDALRLSVAERERLARLGDGEGVEWLAAHYAALDERRPERAEMVRYWIAAVRLAPAAPESRKSE